jgi:multidrug efflux pump subunit AcrA (membrane-fusion protein)
VLWEAEQVLAVPLTALFRDGDNGTLSFVEDGGRAKLRHVTPGRRDGVIAEIREGLEARGLVVVHPSDRVADGVRIASRDGSLRLSKGSYGRAKLARASNAGRYTVMQIKQRMRRRKLPLS